VSMRFAMCNKTISRFLGWFERLGSCDARYDTMGKFLIHSSTGREAQRLGF
jgi:hypothetical protein